MKNILKAAHEEVGIGRVGEENIAESASQVGIGVIMTLAALIGIWGLACLVGGVTDNGVMELARGWLTAVTGM